MQSQLWGTGQAHRMHDEFNVDPRINNATMLFKKGVYIYI